MRARCVREALSNSFPLASSSLSDAERPHRDATGRIYVRNHYSTAELRRCINSMLNNSPQPFTLFILVPVPTAVDRQSLLLDVLIATVTFEMSVTSLLFFMLFVLQYNASFISYILERFGTTPLPNNLHLRATTSR